ncbi:MAG: aminopeptidase N, partial [Gammaproteobacteria bacterium]|nr:aminopeptidase N [Gammaproteobacteria bacterium]
MISATTEYLKDYQPPVFQISEVSLTFELSPQQTRVTAISQVQRHSTGNDALVLNGEDLVLESVAINGQVLSDGFYTISDNNLTIASLPDQFELTIVTTINPLTNTKLEGLYVSDGAFCTQCEAQGFRRITYYLDRPDVMAVFTTKVIADKAQYPFLLSNGNKVDSGELSDGRHFCTWLDPFKKPAYLFALVAGDFDLLEGQFVTSSGREVLLQFFVDKGNKHKAKHALQSLKKAMKWDEERFNLEYDLDIYMVVAVDFFNMGAMENKGLNVFNDKYVLADPNVATDMDYAYVEGIIA